MKNKKFSLIAVAIQVLLVTAAFFDVSAARRIDGNTSAPDTGAGQGYASDFAQAFGNIRGKRDHRKLREYINQKEEELREARIRLSDISALLSSRDMNPRYYLQDLEDDLWGHDSNKVILLRLSSVRPNFNFKGEFTVRRIRNEIIPTIKQRIDDTNRDDSLNNENYMLMLGRIEGLRKDVFLAEQALYESLSPEFRDQNFKKLISFTFFALIGMLIAAFFLIILKRSDSNIAGRLLSGLGLQFITVFVLIIAIVFFGTIGVLGGSELAAILSGISGYILGKGSDGFKSVVRRRENDSAKESAEQELAEKGSDIPAQPETRSATASSP